MIQEQVNIYHEFKSEINLNFIYVIGIADCDAYNIEKRQDNYLNCRFFNLIVFLIYYRIIEMHP